MILKYARRALFSLASPSIPDPFRSSSSKLRNDNVVLGLDLWADEGVDWHYLGEGRTMLNH